MSRLVKTVLREKFQMYSQQKQKTTLWPLGDMTFQVGSSCLSMPYCRNWQLTQILYSQSQVEEKKTCFLLLTTQRRERGLRSEFEDDCGAWISSPSPTQFLISQPNGKLTPVVRRDNVYCRERMMKRKRIYVPIDPQRSEDHIIKLHRNYTSKACSTYKRRISWVGNHGDNKTCVEYIGTFPGAQLHGNADFG